MTCHIYGPQNVCLQRMTFMGSWMVSRSWMKISCHQVGDSNWKTRISILWAIARQTILMPIHILISIWMPSFLWSNLYLFVDWSRQVLKMANNLKNLLEICYLTSKNLFDLKIDIWILNYYFGILNFYFYSENYWLSFKGFF
jgi:hypothetical protein